MTQETTNDKTSEILDSLNISIRLEYDAVRARSLTKVEVALYEAVVAYVKEYEGCETTFVDFVISALHIPLMERGGNQAVVDWYRQRAKEREWNEDSKERRH